MELHHRKDQGAPKFSKRRLRRSSIWPGPCPPGHQKFPARQICGLFLTQL